MTKNQIIASLKYGRFLSGRVLIMVLILLGLCLIGVIMVVTISILMAFGIIKWDINSLPSLIVPIIIFFCGIAFASYLLYQRRIHEKEIQQWLQDAVLLRAYSRAIDTFKMVGHPPEVEIEVVFTYQNLRYVKKSSKLTGLLRTKGHDKIFRYFTNREIDILYSPKFDQVMLIKDW